MPPDVALRVERKVDAYRFFSDGEQISMVGCVGNP
jgi:hypothetical protein